MFESYTPTERELAERVLEQYRATAVAKMQPGAAHPPGCDVGDEADLLDLIFGRRP
ncbi:MAG: hypothetical protein ACRYHQ_31120 [Janthinobacterium lividum]